MQTDGTPPGGQESGQTADDGALGGEAWGDGPIGDEPLALGAAGSDGPVLAGVAAAAPAAAVPTAIAPVAATFTPLAPNEHGDGDAGIDLLLDVSLQVSVELGQTRMKIGEILALRAGSVIELDKLAGEPADILVNGTLIARGEVVVVDEKFGVRVMEVVSKTKRLLSLG